MKGGLLAGAAAVEISPAKGIGLAGYPHHPRPNRGVHDPLYASCLVLQDGETRLAIVALDLLLYSKSYAGKARREIEARTGIPGRNVMICCSHTHSGPWTSDSRELAAMIGGLRPDRAYVESLQSRIVELVVEADRGTFPAAVGIEKGYCGREQGVGGNRRDPRGLADPEVWTVGVKDRCGNWRAVLVKYCLHPTFLHSDNLLVSADYPGYIRGRLQSSKPGVIFLFAQGTSGNQSPRYFRSGKTFAEAERVGTEIAKEADHVLDGMTLYRDAALTVQSTDVDLELRELPPRGEAEASLAKARREWEGIKASGAPEPEVWNAELRFLGAEDTLAFVVQRDQGAGSGSRFSELPAEVQVIGIGDARIVGLPGEIFVEFGLTVQYRSPFVKTFVVELANAGLPGYAATTRAYAEGGYESGASLLTGRSGEQLVDAAVDLLQQTI